MVTAVKYDPLPDMESYLLTVDKELPYGAVIIGQFDAEYQILGYVDHFSVLVMISPNPTNLVGQTVTFYG